jgi:hypothetical protein
MKPYKKSKIAKTTMYRKEYKVETQGLRDWYWSEGINFYPKYRKGFKNPKKTIMSYQIRMYKTWKHNRKKQWK